METSDEEVKVRFRHWMDDPACPWYIREEYIREGYSRDSEAEGG